MVQNISGSFNNSPAAFTQKNEVSPETSKFSKFMKGLGTFAVAAGRAAITTIPGASAVGTFFEAFGAESAMGQYGGMTPYEMLGLQQQMLQEARMFTVLSNIMKVRHDAAMNAIRNIK
ncbi:hypothetical protein K8T06_10255 [bacterium]|nr:hypothetical protein [bacterium]